MAIAAKKKGKQKNHGKIHKTANYIAFIIEKSNEEISNSKCVNLKVIEPHTKLRLSADNTTNSLNQTKQSIVAAKWREKKSDKQTHTIIILIIQWNAAKINETKAKKSMNMNYVTESRRLTSNDAHA